MKKYLLPLLLLTLSQLGICEDKYLVNTIQGHGGSVYSVCFSPDSKYIAAGNDDATVRIWDISTGLEVLTLSGHVQAVQTVCYSPDGNYIASAGQDKAIKIWDAFTGLEVKTLKGHTEPINSVSFMENGKYLISGSDDRTIRIWDTATGKTVKTLKGATKDDHILSVSYSPDGKYIVSGSWDRMISIWDIDSGTDIRTIPAPSGAVDAVSYSPDSNFIASASGKLVKIWDANTGQEVITLGHGDTVWSLSYSKDGKYLATGSGNLVKLWEADSGDEVRTFKEHGDAVSSVSYSPDGMYIASGSADRTIKIWLTPYGQKNRPKGTVATTTTNKNPADTPKMFGGIDRTIVYRIALAACITSMLVVIFFIWRGRKEKTVSLDKLLVEIEANISNIDLVDKLFGYYLQSTNNEPGSITAFKPETICKIYKYRLSMDKAAELPLAYREAMFAYLIKNKDFGNAFIIYKNGKLKNVDPRIVFEMHDKLTKLNDLLTLILFTPPRNRTEDDWGLLVNIYNRFNKLADISPYDLPEDNFKEVIKLLKEKEDYNGLMTFVQAIPMIKRSSSDWELLISLYDKANRLNELNTPDLPDDYCQRMIQLLERKLVKTAPTTPIIEANWELLLALNDRLNKLPDVDPSTLPEEYRKKVISLLEQKKDDAGLIKFIQAIPATKRTSTDWDTLINTYNDLDKLGRLNPADVPEEFINKVILLLDTKKDSAGLINYLSHISEKQWTSETYKLWFESCIKNGMPEDAIRSLSSIKTRTDAQFIYNFYYQRALQFEQEGRVMEAILIYTKFVDENITFKDISARYTKLNGGAPNTEVT